MKNKTYNSIWDINAPKKHWPTPITWSPFPGSSSAPLRCSTGEPQGTVLRLLLFSVYTSPAGGLIQFHYFTSGCWWFPNLYLQPGSFPRLKTHNPYLSSLLGMIYKHLKLDTIKNEFLTSSQNMCQSQSPSFHLMDPSSCLLLRSNLEVILGCSLFLKLTSYPLVNPVALEKKISTSQQLHKYYPDSNHCHCTWNTSTDF